MTNGHLLVTQLEATLEGLPIIVQVRTTQVDGKTYLWPDSNSNDYIHCPLLLERLSSYEVEMNYKKVIKSKKQLRRVLIFLTVSLQMFIAIMTFK